MTTRRGAGLDSLGGLANSHQQVLTDVGLDDDDCYYVDQQGAWRPWPAWMHPECVDTHYAVANGTCCKYPADDLVLRALDLANAVDGTLTAFDVQEVRGVARGDRLGDPRELFWNGYAAGEHRMRFAAEMIVPQDNEDDFGRQAKASRRVMIS